MIPYDSLSPPASVEEIQGLYGALQLRESLLQKIWQKGLFQKNNLILQSGEPLKIINRGELNSLDGPDFKNAHILINNRSLFGDIEIHLAESHWEQHRHQYQESFKKVCLHVFLFSAKKPIVPTMPSLNLLPYLLQDIESYVEEQNLLDLITPRKNISHPTHLKIFQLTPSELQKGAHKRWLQKVTYARARIQRWGCQEAIYQSLCEILGYKRNRLTMSLLSLQYPLSSWNSKPPDSQFLYDCFSKQWKRTGIRPHNHPKKRLQQLCTLMTQHPHWIEKIQQAFPPPIVNGETVSPKSHRKSLFISSLRRKIADEILGGAISGTRFDTLIVDGILPLLTASQKIDYFFLWFSWYSGDIPLQIQHLLQKNDSLKSLDTIRCNGWNQGVLFFLTQGN